MAKLFKDKNAGTDNEVVEATTNEAVETKTELYVPSEDAEKPSLNQLALALGIPAVRLQSSQVAYKPIEGKPYNAKEINWANVSAFIARRLDKTDYNSVEEVYEAALKIEYTPKRGVGRTAGEGSVYGKVLFGTTPLRKGDVKVGDTIYSKKTGDAYDVIFVNDTIVVYEPKHDADTKVVSEAIGNRMFNTNFLLTPPEATNKGESNADLLDGE